MNKTCTKCGIEKPEEAYVRWFDKRRNKFYHRLDCRVCSNSALDMWKKRNPERAKAAAKEWRAANPEKYKKYEKTYRDRNAKRLSLRNAVWRAGNKERLSLYEKERWKRSGAWSSAQNKIYRAANADKLRERAREWVRKNPEKRKIYCQRTSAKRRMRIQLMPVQFRITVAQQQELFEKAKAYGVCPLCNKTPKKWTLDHAVPLSRGGGHTKDNLYYCCGLCNSTKNDKTLEEYCGKSIKDIPYLN